MRMPLLQLDGRREAVPTSVHITWVHGWRRTASRQVLDDLAVLDDQCEVRIRIADE